MKWRTREGKEVEIKSMTDSHLLNAHRYLQRRINDLRELEQFAFSPFAPSEGTVAADDLESCLSGEGGVFDQVISLSVSRNILKKEIKRRGLTPLTVNPPRPLPKIKSVEHFMGGVIFELEKG